MTVLDRAEVILDADDRGLLAGTNRGGVAMVALGNIAAQATEEIARGFVRAGKATIRAAIDMERMERGLEVTAGSAQAAASQMAVLERIAKLPGLGFREVIGGANQLNIAFAEFPDTIGTANRTLEAFGRAVALTGGGPAEFQRVITQVTQMAAAGKVLMHDLRPIIQTAPAVGQALRAAFGTISPQEIEALGLSTEEFFGQLNAALEDLPEPAETAGNALENLEDAAFRAGAALGEIFLPPIVVGAEALASALERSVVALDGIYEHRGKDDVAPGERYGHFLFPGLIDYAELQRPQVGPRSNLTGRAPQTDPSAQMERFRAQAEAINELRQEYADAAEAERLFEERLEFLNWKAELTAQTVELDLYPNLAKLTDLTPFSIEVTDQLAQAFDIEADSAQALAVALGLAADQQDRLTQAQMVGNRILGGLGGLGRAFGTAIPFLGNVGGLFGAFNSFAGFFADGGSIPEGEWGIAGESGPEVISGPATVTPAKAAGATIDLSGMPPAGNPLAMARDRDWTDFLHRSLDTLGERGWAT